MTNQVYVCFLENVIKDVQNTNMNIEQLQLLIDFKNKYTNTDDFINNRKIYSDRDFIKFIVMGWYIYNLISSNEEIPDELPEPD